MTLQRTQKHSWMQGGIRHTPGRGGTKTPIEDQRVLVSCLTARVKRTDNIKKDRSCGPTQPNLVILGGRFRILHRKCRLGGTKRPRSNSPPCSPDFKLILFYLFPMKRDGVGLESQANHGTPKLPTQRFLALYLISFSILCCCPARGETDT